MCRPMILIATLAVLPTLAAADDSSCVFGPVDEFRALLPREPRFAKAAEFLARPDLKTLPVGRYEVDGEDVFAMVQECKLKDRASDPKPEAHRTYIDIQVPLSGEETFGYGWLTEKNYTKPFDRKKDFGLYREQPLQWRTLKPGEFAVFFPPYGRGGPSRLRVRVGDARASTARSRSSEDSAARHVRLTGQNAICYTAIDCSFRK